MLLLLIGFIIAAVIAGTMYTERNRIQAAYTEAKAEYTKLKTDVTTHVTALETKAASYETTVKTDVLKIVADIKARL